MITNVFFFLFLRLKAKLAVVAPEELEDGTLRHSFYARSLTVNHGDNAKNAASENVRSNNSKKTTKPFASPGEYSLVDHKPYENFEMFKQKNSS